MITCCKCKEQKPDEAYPWKNQANGIRQPYCKECKKAYNQKWYANAQNRQNQITRAAVNKKKYMQRMMEWKAEYIKQHGGCSYEGCDIENPVMIDFDHLDRTTKTLDIGSMFSRGYNLSVIEEEASKCRLLCANHHRLWTAEQMGWASHAFVSALPPK